MRKSACTTPAPRSAPTSDSNRIERLESAVIEMDGYTQSGCTKIKAIARLTLDAMQTPDAWRNPDNFAHALKAIFDLADALEDCVNVAAEEVGCNFKDAEDRRRSESRQMARN